MPAGPRHMIVFANAKLMRAQSPFSQSEVAERLNVSVDVLREFEQGRKAKADVWFIHDLGRIYGYTVEQFLQEWPNGLPAPDMEITGRVWFRTEGEIAEDDAAVAEKLAHEASRKWDEHIATKKKLGSARDNAKKAKAGKSGLKPVD